MKLGKKLLSLLTVLCLTLSLFPTMAFAVDDGEGSTGSPATSVSVGSTTLSVGDYLASNGTVTTTEPNEGTGYIHFSSDGTLELNNYNDESSGTTHQISGNSGEDLIIKLNGDNHITSSGNGIRSYGKLTISGPGSLTLTAAQNTTIYAQNTITIKDGAKVTAPCGQDGQSIHLNSNGKEIIITGSNTEVNASNSTNRKGEIRCGYSARKDTTCTGLIQLNDGAKLTASIINGTLKINGQDNSSSSNEIDEVTASSTTYTVSGAVKNGNTPVVGASVQLRATDTSAGTEVIPTSTTTDDTGAYTFSNVPNGTYTITVSKDGYTAELSELSKAITVNRQNGTQDFSITPIPYNISVKGIPVTGANKDNVLNDATATVKYTPANGETAQKLTLNGMSITNTSQVGITASNDLTIALSGENKISSSAHAIEMTSGTLTITGPGSLNASSSSGQTTIYAKGNVEINGGAKITATNTGESVGDVIDLYGSNDNLTITGNGTQVVAQKTTGSATAINHIGTLTVNNGATLLVQSNGTAISCTTLSHSDNDYIAEASVGYDGSNPGPYVPSNVSNYKCVHVYPKTASVKHYGVWIGSTELTSANNSISGVSYDPDTQTLTLNGAEITGAPNRQYTSKIKDACGIYSKHDLTIKLTDTNTVRGSTETQDNGSYGIFVSGKLTFTSDSNGSITVSGGTSSNSGNAWVPGVYASGITVKNCNVTAIGGTATSDSYPVAYAMSKAPTLVGAKVTETNTTNRADGATKDNYSASSISRYKYLKIEQTSEEDTTVAAPVIAPEGGYFTSDPHVTISCPTDDATIYYTTNGNAPSISEETKYTENSNITLQNETTTVKAIAVKTVNGQQQQSVPVEATFTKREPGNEVTEVTLSLDARDRTMRVGDTSELTATVKHEGREIKDDSVTVTWASDNTDVATVVDGVITAKSVGKARITAAVVENGVTYSDFCDVIVEARPASSHHSSSSTTYYDVNAAVSGEGGSVAASTKRASRGTTVTVTATAASGYQVAQVSAVDKDGKTVSLTDKGDGVYTFVMPASKVDVTARFAQVQKPEEKDPYGDVSKDSYYYDAVKWAAETGVTTGVGDGLFAPEWVCTRGQIVTFLWRASGSPAPKATELPFTDVAADTYYAQAVLWAVENGITNGTSETTFGPDQTCTRAHAVAFLYRMSGSPAAVGSTFSDVAADAYYSTAVAWAVEKGITNGTSGTTFSPDDTCTRGQIVTFLYRLAQTK